MYKIVELWKKDQKPMFCIECNIELKTMEYFGGISAYCLNKNCKRYGINTSLIKSEKTGD